MEKTLVKCEIATLQQIKRLTFSLQIGEKNLRWTEWEETREERRERRKAEKKEEKEKKRMEERAIILPPPPEFA